MNFKSIISTIFGSKFSRDMKEIQPWVEKCKAAQEKLKDLSNDELRARTLKLREQIQGSVTEQEAKIAELKEKIEETPIEDREVIFNQIDRLEKDILERLDKALDEALDAMESTLKGYAGNATVEAQCKVINANYVDNVVVKTYTLLCDEAEKLYNSIKNIKK